MFVQRVADPRAVATLQPSVTFSSASQLTHVVQQNGMQAGVPATPPIAARRTEISAPTDAGEREAERVGAEVAALGPAAGG